MPLVYRFAEAVDQFRLKFRRPKATEVIWVTLEGSVERANNNIPVFRAFYYSGLKQLVNIPFRQWERNPK